MRLLQATFVAIASLLCLSMVQAGATDTAGPASAEQIAAEVEVALADIAEDESVLEVQRARLAETYRQAQSQIDLHTTWRARAEGFQADTESAPALVARVRSELNRPVLSPELPLRYDTPIADVERDLLAAQAQLESAQDARASLDKTIEVREQRRVELARTIAERKQEAASVSTELNSLLQLADPTREQEAQRLLLRSRRLALEAEVESHQSELTNFEASTELVALQDDLADRRVNEAEAMVAAWSSAAEERRQREATKAAREADAAAQLVGQISPALREEAEGYRNQAQQRAELARSLEETAARHKAAEAELARVRTAFSDARRRIDVAGLTDAVGLLLRRHKAELTSGRELRRRADQRKERFAALQLAKLDLEDLDARLRNEREIVEVALHDVPQEARADTEAQARDLFRAYRRVVAESIQDVDRQFRQLLDLEQTELQLLSASAEFADYINERILWVRSGKPLWETSFAGARAGVTWLIDPTNWKATGSTLWRDAKALPFWYIAAGALLGALIALRRTVRRRMLTLGAEASDRSCRSLAPTSMALACTFGLLVPGPAIVWLLGWRLSTELDAPAFSKALGLGLRASTLPFLLVEVVRLTCRSSGLGEKHFDWPAPQLKRIRRRLLLLAATVLPLYFLVSFFEAHGEAVWRQTLGRLALVGALGALSLFLHNVLLKGTNRPPRAELTCRAVISVVPLALALVAISGYTFTSLELTRRLLMTFGLGVTAALIYALVCRWLLVARRRIRRDQALERRRKSQELGSAEAEIPVEEDKVDLGAVTLQSRLLLRNVLVLLTLLGGWVVWVDVLPALRIFDQFELWSTTATRIDSVVGADGTAEAITTTTLRSITLGNVLFAILVLLVTYYGARNIPSILEVSILQRFSVGPGERYAVATLTRYAITVTGVVAAFGVIGIGWAKVQWLAAAVTVGLGFGLQEIFGNFVSGLIILFERPMRVGDFVTVGETDGRVTKIRMRATTITDWDLREMIVPNKEFITGRLINWTLSNPITRVVFPVGVAYGSNTDEARRLMLEIAKEDPLVLREPAPSTVFVTFGDSVLDIHLRVFLENRDNWAELVTRINTNIHDRFAKAGIEIAFPQRDLHLRSIGPLEDALRQHPGLVVEEVRSPSRR